MPTFELTVETGPQAGQVRLRLQNEVGADRGAHEVRLAEHEAWWEGLFDTRRYVKRYENALRDEHGRAKTAADPLEDLGVFLGQKVLGPQIIKALTRTPEKRTLLIRLPSNESDALAVALARVPWELARVAPGGKSLMDRNFVVRSITQNTEADDSAVAPVPSAETMRVLAIFADAPGSRPLATRLERERLRELFEKKILPKHNVEFEVLCHGVTPRILEERIRSSGGFHILHWSGHGHPNGLELLGDNDHQLSLSGHDLVKLIRSAGVPVPQLFYLSVRPTSTVTDGDDWKVHCTTPQRVGGGDRRTAGSPRKLHEILDDAPGCTGIALALLHAGVPQVVAMRCSVSDDYARKLSCCFYNRLLGDDGERSTEAALDLARTDVRREEPAAATRTPVDHANALLFGQEGRRLVPGQRRGKEMQRLRPQPKPLLPEGSKALERPKLFVGRGESLTQINRAWQQSGHESGHVVTVLHGPQGMGKTSLAAEALHLWHHRFNWVLAFQAEGTGLAVEDFLKQVHQRLQEASTVYRGKCEEAPYERVYFETSEVLKGEPRYSKMFSNLVEALREEAVLMVLDNFEFNLDLQDAPSNGGYACKDPHWNALLRTLRDQLPQTQSGSRVLVTSEYPPSALTETLWLPVEEFSSEETALYVRSHEQLSKLLKDEAGCELLKRMSSVARRHPTHWSLFATLLDQHGNRKPAATLEPPKRALPGGATRDSASQDVPSQNHQHQRHRHRLRFIVEISLGLTAATATIIAVYAFTSTPSAPACPDLGPLPQSTCSDPYPPPQPDDGFQELLGHTGSDDTSGWRDLDLARTFEKNETLRIEVGGHAACVAVRLLQQGQEPKTMDFVVGDFKVPQNRTITVSVDQKYKSISQVSVHGGHAWNQHCIDTKPNGEARINSLKVRPPNTQ